MVIFLWIISCAVAVLSDRQVQNQINKSLIKLTLPNFNFAYVIYFTQKKLPKKIQPFILYDIIVDKVKKFSFNFSILIKV